ncbi:MAG: response regulator [Lachnospiraceae bacterium]|nr:response regulator [Lachnospiraceae bacterium]
MRRKLSLMKIIKDYLKRDDKDVRERLFMLLAGIALIGMLVAIIGGIIIGENIQSILSVIISFIFFIILVRYGSVKGKLIQVSYITGAVIVFIVMPVNFFTSGAIHGGAAIWNVFYVMYIALVLRGKPRAILLTCQAVMVCVIYYIYYKYPETVLHHTEETAFNDSLASFFVVSIILVIMISFQTWLYIKENDRSQKQSEEIKALNQAQSRFFSSMSHEIRTPINTIIGLNEMILREDLPDEIREDAKNIESASKILLHLINDILDMSKIESGKMEILSADIDLATMVEDIKKMIKVRAKEKDLAFSVDVSPKLPAIIKGDEVRIKQILINLLNNSVKYTIKGSVKLSIYEETSSENESIVFSVTDTGMGIKEESLPYLFNAFQRVDEHNTKMIEGTGLGLTIVKQLVDLMNGEISVYSEYAKGSTFTVKLPLERVGDASINMSKTNKNKTSKKNYLPMFTAPEARILVVDDIFMNIRVLERLLNKTEMTIESATSGKQALEMTLKNNYDLIFMDHEMPEMNGVECFHEIRSQENGKSNNAKVIILTANAATENADYYKAEGFDSYMTKPVDSRLLESELIRLLPEELLIISK